jgi:hypothetical protein
MVSLIFSLASYFFHPPFWGHFCETISYTSITESYCLSDISPSRTHNRRDRSPGYRLCYVTEQYVPRIGYLKERVRT